ncbi:MAG: hypothetical protein GOU99_03980, partial [Candidatus Altiarchaeota archaeon]|nr:hypothetical protein [Candidatus Altiarchaeota archaeon]
MAKKSVKKIVKKSKLGSTDPIRQFVNAYKMPIAFALIVVAAFVPIPSMQTNSQAESSFGFSDSLATRLFAGSSTEISPAEAGQLVVSYLNNNLVSPGTEASLVSVIDLGAVYQVTTEYQGNQIPVFATKDG